VDECKPLPLMMTIEAVAVVLVVLIAACVVVWLVGSLRSGKCHEGERQKVITGRRSRCNQPRLRRIFSGMSVCVVIV
jgi:hypothetical protein